MKNYGILNTQLKDLVIHGLELRIPKGYSFHNVVHTMDVLDKAIKIGIEEISDSELKILATSALFHDLGYLETIKSHGKGHEDASIELAKKILPNYNYSEKKIKKVCKIINATKIPHKPKGLLEEIMCDADLDHLGRWDFWVRDQLFKAELEYVTGVKRPLADWYREITFPFLEQHKYFTKTSKTRRQKKKQEHIQYIKEFLKCPNEVLKLKKQMKRLQEELKKYQ